MKTSVSINESLLTEAMKWSGATTKVATIHEALQQLVEYKKRMKLIGMAGKVKLDVDIVATRKRG